MLTASDTHRKPRPQAVPCSACGLTQQPCDTGFWLRGGYCCPACRHTPDDPQETP